MRRFLCLLLTAAAVFGAGACGGDDKKASPKLKEITAASMPTELLGMPVQAEPSADLIKGDRQAFIDEIGLFSMRKDDLLQATLQISKFSPDANVDDRKFRDALATQISSAEPQILRMGEHQIYMSASAKQSLVVWFKDRTMFVLAVRQEFEQPRALLREALAKVPA